MELGQDGNIAALTYPIYVHFYFDQKWVIKMHEKFMIEAIKEANKSLEINELPVGAIIAIEKSTRKVKNWRLIDCDIYVTLEPCPMCASAIKQSRIKKIYYGAESTYNNNHKIFQDICNSSDNNDKINYYHNIMQLECSELLRKFFVSKR